MFGVFVCLAFDRDYNIIITTCKKAQKYLELKPYPLYSSIKKDKKILDQPTNSKFTEKQLKSSWPSKTKK